MPWTPRQKRYLQSSGSPLTPKQKAKMKAEMHAKSAMGNMKKKGAMNRYAKMSKG